MTLRAHALAFVATLILAGCSGDGATTPGARRVPILFEGYAAGIPEMFWIDTAGGTPARVLPEGTRAMDPTPSPDGTRIAFVVANYTDATGDIFIVDANGGLPRPLTVDEALDDSPAWSPDGQRLAYRSYAGGHEGEIWVVDADGTDAVNLTPTVGSAIIDNRRPSWSPDGQWIVFASTRGGDWGIWIMRNDGSDERQLTNTIDLDAEPVWSPDGAWIAFRRTDGSGSDIMVVAAGGGEPRRIQLAGEQRLPDWSPDGQWLAFVSQPSPTAQPELFLIRADGGGVRPLTTEPSWRGGLHPAWWRRP